jgi:hypothetical protein
MCGSWRVEKKTSRRAWRRKEKKKKGTNESRCMGRCNACTAEVIGDILAIPVCCCKEEMLTSLADAKKDGV